MVQQIETARADEYQKLAVDLKANYGADVNETFWLIKGVVAEMPLGAVKALAVRDDVRYIEPGYSGEPPPADGNNFNDVDDGRGRIVSDPYFNLNQTTGFIGILDTGVRSTHTLYSSNLSIVNDCTTNASCSGGNPQDDCWNHGTSTGAIISGNANLGAAFRGVTDITLDSFKVYPPVAVVWIRPLLSEASKGHWRFWTGSSWQKCREAAAPPAPSRPLQMQLSMPVRSLSQRMEMPAR